MDYGKFLKSIFLSVSMLIVVGCGSSSSTSDIAASATVKEEIPSENFAEGTVITETVIEAKADDQDNKVLATVVIEEGTQFTTPSGEVSTETPILEMETIQGTEDKESKVTLSFVDPEGKNLIPTAPVKVAVRAPEGASPGDKVTIDVPEGVENISKQEKLTVFIVGSNGFINILVFPTVFKNQDVIVFIFVIDPPVTPTGAGS